MSEPEPQPSPPVKPGAGSGQIEELRQHVEMLEAQMNRLLRENDELRANNLQLQEEISELDGRQP